MLIDWIWLATRTGMSDHTKRSLLDSFGSPEQIFLARREDYLQWGTLTEEALNSLCSKDLSSCQTILNRCGEKKIEVLTFQDAGYPERLKNIPDPPMVLYYRGAMPLVDSEVTIGVVGTRSASAYGLKTAKTLGYQIGACGGCVVSGAASGIDFMAMTGALTSGSMVIGVLGCGADVVYPASNKSLYEDLIRYGCILTEFPPGTPPLGQNFPRRNRIISGISCGVLVVEAPLKSGALITAHHALDQGRDVFAVPSNIDVDSGTGSNLLLREGAIAVMSGWDVVSEYRYQYPGKVYQEKGKTVMQIYPEEITAVARREKKPKKNPGKNISEGTESGVSSKLSIDKQENESYIDLIKKDASFSEDEKTVACCLEQGKMLVDDLIEATGLSAGRVLASLTLLEVKGVICRLPGKFVQRSGRK